MWLCRASTACEPGGGDGHAGFRHLGLEAGEPGVVGRAVLEQQVALAHQLLEDGDARGMFGIEGG